MARAAQQQQSLAGRRRVRRTYHQTTRRRAFVCYETRKKDMITTIKLGLVAFVLFALAYAVETRFLLWSHPTKADRRFMSTRSSLLTKTQSSLATRTAASWRFAMATCCAETLVGCFLAQRVLSVPTTALGSPLHRKAGTVPFATLGHRDV
jgi:hypothetical protein